MLNVRKPILVLLAFVFSFGQKSYGQDTLVVRKYLTTRIEYSCTTNEQDTYQFKIDEIEQIEACLQKAFSLYPNYIIEQNIKEIQITKQLNLGNQSIGGLQSHQKISLRIPEVTNKNLAIFSGIIHHEIAHILLTKYRKKFKKADWKKCNQRQYSHQLRKTLQSNQLGIDSVLVTKGFLSEYGRVNFHEDFAVFAERAMVFHPNFETILKESCIREKYEQVVLFYHSIDPNIITQKYVVISP